MNFYYFGKDIYIKKVFIVICVIILASVLGTTGYIINQKSKAQKQIVFEKDKEAAVDNLTNKASTTQAADEIQKQETESKAKEEIKVYITGCVKNPGIVTIEKNQLINDAIEKAGGTTADADISNINLVYPIKENLMLYIKSKEESKTTNNAGEAGRGIFIANDSIGAVVNSPSSGEATKGKVNINTASIDELDTLPGVGKQTAKDIISYREKKPFKTIKDVCQVPGIKENKYNKIKDFITVE